MCVGACLWVRVCVGVCGCVWVWVCVGVGEGGCVWVRVGVCGWGWVCVGEGGCVWVCVGECLNPVLKKGKKSLALWPSKRPTMSWHVGCPLPTRFALSNNGVGSN